MLISCHANQTLSELEPNPKINMPGFLRMSSEVQTYRKSRLIDIETFNQFAKDEKTIILDTRSKSAYDKVHMKGAIHLNFADFTTQKLAKVIPDQSTRILIYCNNNLQSKKEALMDKRVELALNIPTFINLYGYGYHNIYELNDYLAEDDTRVALVENIHLDQK